LKTAVEAGGVCALSIKAGYETLPSWTLRPIIVGNAVSGIELEAGVDKGISAKVPWIESEEIQLSQACNDFIIRYKAGYTPSVDNGDHTALVSTGNVPTDLKWVTIVLAKDIRDYINITKAETSAGMPAGSIKSESIADYSYTLADGSTGNEVITKIIKDKYDSILHGYTRKSIGG
jgi:hypothetical protein